MSLDPATTSHDDRGRRPPGGRLEWRRLAGGERPAGRRRQHARTDHRRRRRARLAAQHRCPGDAQLEGLRGRVSSWPAIRRCSARTRSSRASSPASSRSSRRSGYSLVLQVVHDDKAAVSDAYRRLAREGRVDGVFLTDLRRDDPRLPLVQELRPSRDRRRQAEPAGARCPSIGIDDRVGIRAGRRPPGRARAPSGSPSSAAPRGYVHSAARLAAWREALRRRGLPIGPAIAADFTGRRRRRGHDAGCSSAPTARRPSSTPTT